MSSGRVRPYSIGRQFNTGASTTTINTAAPILKNGYDPKAESADWNEMLLMLCVACGEYFNNNNLIHEKMLPHYGRALAFLRDAVKWAI
jgi:hypothetical protein